MLLDDFVMLGKTVPEPTSSGRVFVCSAGISPTHGLIRVYPLSRRKGSPPRWSQASMPLTRNPRDSRAESWMIDADRSLGRHESINEAITIIGAVGPNDRAGLIVPHVAASVQEANAKRLSLAVVEPLAAPELRFVHDPRSPNSPHLRLFYDHDDQQGPGLRFPFIPRLCFHDEGGSHDLMLRDWGAFEFLRKFPERKDELSHALRLDPTVSLLIGNFNAHRSSWCVISVLRGVRLAQTSLTLEAA